MTAHGAHVTDVQLPRLAQALLDVQAEELRVGRFEVAADRVDGDAWRLTLARREDRGWAVVGPYRRRGRTCVQHDGFVRLGTRRVVVGATGAAIGNADVAEEGLSGGLVKVDAIVGADDRAVVHLIGNSEARREVELV